MLHSYLNSTYFKDYRLRAPETAWCMPRAKSARFESPCLPDILATESTTTSYELREQGERQ